ncbi:AzlC family ABC transporter permease [Nocardia altamirensis]|uniref:AzlC family ABC transporter permease n=1 Tax=Nocardia altamirensis TaxID=472158 RepID=UPI003F76E5D7
MRSIWRTLGRDTASGIVAVCLAVALIGVSYGATAVSSGLPMWLPMVLGVVVLAGGAEFLFIGIIAAGGSPIAAVLAGLVVNARHLPYGLSVPDMVGTGWRRWLGVHLMNDESVAMSLAQSDTARKRAAYWATGFGVLIAWPGGAAIGALVGTLVPDTSVIGLDAVFPAVLLSLVIPALSDRATLRAVLVGAAIAIATAPFLPAGMPVLAALLGLLVVGRGASEDKAAEDADMPQGTTMSVPLADRAATSLGTVVPVPQTSTASTPDARLEVGAPVPQGRNVADRADARLGPAVHALPESVAVAGLSRGAVRAGAE